MIFVCFRIRTLYYVSHLDFLSNVLLCHVFQVFEHRANGSSYEVNGVEPFEVILVKC